MKIYPEKLKKGDEIRIIAPSHSCSYLWESSKEPAYQNLTAAGFKVTFAKNCYEIDETNSSPIKSRIEDLNEAFADKNVKAVLCVMGGFNANQIIDRIDYELIAANPKLFCGYSDITVLLNAIYEKTGLITYHGPGYANFGNNDTPEKNAIDLAAFVKIACYSGEYSLGASVGKSLECVVAGEACGTAIGGNLCTLQLLQGTEYFPTDSEVIAFIEDDNICGEFFAMEFERNLHSLAQVLGNRLKGIVIGSYTDECNMTDKVIEGIIRRFDRNIPVISNADFGHIPTFSAFPIGADVRITASKNQSEIYFNRI